MEHFLMIKRLAFSYFFLRKSLINIKFLDRKRKGKRIKEWGCGSFASLFKSQNRGFIFLFFIKYDYYNLIEIVGFVVSFLEGNKPKIEEE